MPNRCIKIGLLIALVLPISVFAGVKIERTKYKNWQAISISNGQAKIIVVPGVGRVMQFTLAGDDGVFWENEKLAGASFAFDQNEWLNFGGDKVWVAPIGNWRRMMKRSADQPNFPPPPAFDGLPYQAEIKRNAVELISPVDPFYGIRIRRKIKLENATMRIKTTFEKIKGEPVRVSIWTVTQLESPQKIFLLLPDESVFENGFTKLSANQPPSLRRDNKLLQLERDGEKPFKIGSDALRMLWIGENATLEMFAPRIEKAEYPDANSSVEIYTAPDALGYVELETLGALEMLAKGQKISLTTTYILRRRSEPKAEAEAEKLWFGK